MGNQLEWQERFNIGVEVIDREHRKLFSILRKLLADRNKDERSKWVCQEGIKYFKEHAMKHFAEEEVYMASISYAGFDTHRRVHDNFRKKTLPALEKELNQSDYSPEAMNHFLGVCAGWLIGHTLTEDRAITGKVVSRWGSLLPEEEQAAMRQMILQLLEDMFQLKARVVSECYGGEKFGKGICCEQVGQSFAGRRTGSHAADDSSASGRYVPAESTGGQRMLRWRKVWKRDLLPNGLWCQPAGKMGNHSGV